MKKIISLFLCALISITFLVSCASKLPDGMTEHDLKAAGENVIALLNAQDYDALNAMLDEDMAAALEETPLDVLWEPICAELGEYEKLEKSAITSQDGYAVYVAQVKYSNSSIVFTLSFDKDYNLSGLFYK